jgi:hypothetical protein
MGTRANTLRQIGSASFLRFTHSNCNQFAFLLNCFYLFNLLPFSAKISSPNCEFDIGYIRFFRIVDTFRNKMLPSTVELLKSLDLALNKDWIYAGRPCSPRVLFTFENCPSHILQVGQENPENVRFRFIISYRHIF